MTTAANTLEQAVEFAKNSEPRCPCVLVLDTSTSTEGEPIDQLTKGLQQFLRDLKKNALASKRCEIAIVSFNSEITVEQDFITPDGLVPPSLKADGCTGFSRWLPFITAAGSSLHGDPENAPPFCGRET